MSEIIEIQNSATNGCHRYGRMWAAYVQRVTGRNDFQEKIIDHPNKEARGWSREI